MGLVAWPWAAVLQKVVLLRLVNQGGDTHAPARLDAAPGAGNSASIKSTTARAPITEQLQAHIVGIFAFDGHANARPFIARQVGGDKAQCVAHQVWSNGCTHWATRCALSSSLINSRLRLLRLSAPAPLVATA